MARVPMGKVLLRNVIRHTDAHNKIQEESEMWKMRDLEKQTTSSHKHLSLECVRGRMHCDREPDYFFGSAASSSYHDDREARYWTRKLYEFEENDPDRWGHSGFKELYPEEFHSDGEETSGDKNRKRKKSKSDGALSKHSKKSSRKKRRKKKEEKKKRKRTPSHSRSSGGDSSEDDGAAKGKQRRKKSKGRHKEKKRARSRGSEEEHSGKDEERRKHRQKKRKLDKGSDSGWDSQKKRRKDWKVADESSGDSSAD